MPLNLLGERLRVVVSAVSNDHKILTIDMLNFLKRGVSF